MYCPKCGRENPEHFKFCLACGEDLSAAQQAFKQTAATPSQADLIIKQMERTTSPDALAHLALQLSAQIPGALLWRGGDQPLTVAPAPAPRALPERFWGEHVSPDISFWLLFGSIFSVVGLIVGVPIALAALATRDIMIALIGVPLSSVFALIGLVSLYKGLSQLSRAKAIWRTGHVAIARVTEISYNHNMRINGRHPLQISYTYEVEGQPHSGLFSSTKVAPTHYAPGQPVHILYDPASPADSVLGHNLPLALDADQGADGAW